MDISGFVEVAKRLNVLGIKITKDSELIAEWYSEAERRVLPLVQLGLLFKKD